MVKPKQILLNKEIGEVMKKGLPQFGDIELNGTNMPIEFQIESFFSIPGTLNSTLKFIETISNFVQGDLWMSKSLSENSIPLFLY